MVASKEGVHDGCSAAGLAPGCFEKYGHRMPTSAASLGIRTSKPARVSRALVDLAGGVTRPTAAVVFLSGEAAEKLPAVAAEIRAADTSIPTLCVSGAGVMTEAGEIEGQSAAALLVWSGGRAEPLAAVSSSPDEVGGALARTITDRAGKSEPAVLIFTRPDGFSPQCLEPLQQARGTRNVFGAGTVGSHTPMIIDGGEITEGAAVGFLLRGHSPPSIRASHACRLLGPLKTITEIRGSMVVRLDDQPALDVLSSMGQDLVDQPLIFAVLAPEVGAGPDRGGRPQLVVRAIQGVDPVRRSLMVSDEIREGLRMTFAIRDGAASRRDLETVTRELAREIAGAAPRFGLYLNCAGRGSTLYDAFDVDSRILKSRFGGTPIAGMQSSFEIAPHLGKPTLQLYTGVLGLFTSPS